MRRPYPIFVPVALFLLIAGTVGTFTYWDPFPQLALLQKKTVPLATLVRGVTGQVLIRLGLLQVQPNDYQHYKHRALGTLESRRRLYHTESRVGVQLLGLNRRKRGEALPSTEVVSRELIQRKIPILSIVVDPLDLWDPNIGLLVHPFARGRSWERPAYVSFFEEGHLRFEGGAGLRIHGGGRRRYPKKSFRLHLRDVYGAPSFGKRILFGGKWDPITSLVVSNDEEYEYRFMTPLAYDISRLMGLPAPHTQAVRFLLNGKKYGNYFLTEHITDSYFKAHFGHNDFEMIKTRGEQGKKRAARYQELHDWANHPELTWNAIKTQIDLVNYFDWLVFTLFTTNEDPFQGPILRDRTQPNGKWFWIPWDMDNAFIWAANPGLNRKKLPPWEHDTFRHLLNPLNTDPRGQFLIRFRHEPEFKAGFRQRFERAQARLTPQRLRALVRRYATLATELDIELTDEIEQYDQFLTHRWATLRRHCQKYGFNLSPTPAS